MRWMFVPSALEDPVLLLLLVDVAVVEEVDRPEVGRCGCGGVSENGEEGWGW